MKIEQIYTGCLAQGAYYIVSNGEAAIIDPLREVEPYLERLKEDGVDLKYIFETHFHADFVSGHVELSKRTGAPIIYGPTATPSFEATVAEDEMIFALGDITIKLLHTPGHTMESSCFLLMDAAGEAHSIFTGDTLFLGDVGRPDLAQKAADMTQEQLAGMLYDSLHAKILTLPDSLTVYPGHGAGSACGKNMQKETVDTLGNQRKTNYALNQANREAFVQAVTEGLLPPPGYFGMNVAMNKEGYEDLSVLKEKALKPIAVTALVELVEAEDAVVLDTRGPDDFKSGFIPGSINIGIKGGFAPWVGALLVDVNTPIVLVVDEGKGEEVVTRLSRVGFDRVIGIVDGGVEAWKSAGFDIEEVERIDPQTFAAKLTEGDRIVDVRKPGEYEAEHIEDAYSRPLSRIDEWIEDARENQPFYMHCAGGYRSMIAASILKANDIHDFVEIAQGYGGIKKHTSIPRTDFVCSSKTV